MKTIRFFASRWPLYFVILLILSTVIVESVSGFLAVILFRGDLADPILGPIVLITTVLYLLFLLWRFEWLKPTGVASLGDWKGWLVALVMLVYYLFELLYSFFGDFHFSIPTEAVRGLKIPNVFIGSMFEEILFRGVVLYALVRAWDTQKHGVLKAALTSAILFGLIHAVNALTGESSEVLGQVTIAFVEGIWWAGIVLRWGSMAHSSQPRSHELDAADESASIYGLPRDSKFLSYSNPTWLTPGSLGDMVGYEFGT